MNNIFLVGAGGFIGSALRYLVGGYVQQFSKSVNFPYGTLAVNLVGCFLIGFLAQLAESKGAFTDEARLFVFVGILGGFTTFSAFGNETVNLMRQGLGFSAFANISANVMLGLLVVWLGRAIGYLIWEII